MQFTEIYFRPFRGDPGGYSSYIWCDRSTMCFSILQKHLKPRILALLNGDEAVPFLHVEADGDYIIVNGSPCPINKRMGTTYWLWCSQFRGIKSQSYSKRFFRMDCSTIKEKMSNEYEKPDKPTNHRIPRRAPKIEVPKEHSNELWYQ